VAVALGRDDEAALGRLRIRIGEVGVAEKDRIGGVVDAGTPL
jgi:hypothetical protein